VVPSEHEQETIHRIIYDELVQGVIDPASKDKVMEIVSRMSREEGITGVIAGCTEIELLVTANDIDLPYFPTTSLHARFAAAFSLTEAS